MGIDIASRQAALEQARQNLPPPERQLEQTRDLIGELSDNMPSQDVLETFIMASLHYRDTCR